MDNNKPVTSDSRFISRHTPNDFIMIGVLRTAYDETKVLYARRQEAIKDRDQSIKDHDNFKRVSAEWEIRKLNRAIADALESLFAKEIR